MSRLHSSPEATEPITRNAQMTAGNLACDPKQDSRLARGQKDDVLSATKACIHSKRSLSLVLYVGLDALSNANGSVLHHEHG